MGNRVTLRIIAKAAGVHFTTVGLALRNDPRIKADTRSRVQATAHALGYTRDAMLSALSAYRRGNRNRFTGVIALITTYGNAALKTNVTEQLMREHAGTYAQSQGFALEPFQINASGMTAARMSRMLRARNIQGLIFSARIPTPGPMPDLEWEHFSPVAIGYSITNLRLHRACVHHAYNTRLCLRTLRERGYRRIGLAMQYDIFERNFGITLGSFYAEQCLFPEKDRVVPLITDKVTKAAVGKWLREQRIDCVLLTDHPLQIQAWIRELGYDVPNEMGICLTCRFGMTDGLAGIDEQMGLMGVTAVDLVVSMLQHNERGLPASPHYTLIEGRWVERPTVRPFSAEFAPPAGCRRN